MNGKEFEKLIEIIKNFKGKKIAVVGDIILDNYIYGIPRHNPEADAICLTIDKDKEEFRLGGAANAARNALSLGAEVDLYGVIGNDESGKQIRILCNWSGINLVVLEDGETIKKTRVMGKRFNHPLMRLDYGEQNLRPLTESDENFLLECMSKTSHYDGILLPDYDKRVLRGRLATKVIKWANQNNILTVVDPKSKNSAEASKFHGATLIKPNLEEANLILGNKGLPKEELVKLLKEKMGSRYAVITCGKDGLITYDCSYHYLPTVAREVVDVSGAGDTNAAALLLSLASGADIVQAGTIANYASGIAVEKAGTAAVRYDELIRRILQEKDSEDALKVKEEIVKRIY